MNTPAKTQIALILAASLLVACSQDDTAADAGEEAAGVAPAIVAGTQPVVDDATPAVATPVAADVTDTADEALEPVSDDQGDDDAGSNDHGPQGDDEIVPPKVYDEGCPANKEEWDMVPPVFKHVGVDLGPIDHATGWAGAFNFNDMTALGSSTQFFEPFGHQAHGYAPISDWIFATAPGTNIYSPIDGIVVWVAHNTNWDDWEVIINPRNCSKSFYVVSVDHIVDVQVAIGDRVTAGQVIGYKGQNLANGQWEGNARSFEITISNANGEAFCPLMFFAPDQRAVVAAQLGQLLADMEAYQSPNVTIDFNYLGDKFDESAWAAGGSLVGCYMESNSFVGVPVSQ